jgi:putative DNA primase/helicase
VLNGRLNIATGIIEPHTPEIFEVVQIPVNYDPTAVCPHFDNFLTTTLDADIIPLAEEILGYCLIPITIFEKAVMLLGEGSNGKSVFLHVLISLLGRENVATEALHDFEENRFRVADLYGKLANICADLDYRALKSSQMFKKIVSGDPITGERKFKNPFSFSPYARLLFSSNRLPTTKDITYAFYRRWLIVAFTRTFEGEDADTKLREKLETELPGIFNRALSGLRRLLAQNKFSEPDAVKTALDEYQEENNSLIPFVSECVKPGGYVAKKTLYKSYAKWCADQGYDPVNQKEIKATVLKFPNVRERRIDGGDGPWVWDGISLMDNAPAFEKAND